MMIKDFFQKNIDLMNELRSEHFKYTEYLSKGKYKLKQKFFGKGKFKIELFIPKRKRFQKKMQIGFDERWLLFKMWV